MSRTLTDAETIKATVQVHYGARIQSASSGCGSGGSSCCDGEPTQLMLYSAQALAQLPADVVTTSYGCGNSLTLAAYQPGESVLDLGAGGGLQVLLAAWQVEPTGCAYGLERRRKAPPASPSAAVARPRLASS